MRRLIRGTFKLAILAAVAGAIVAVARKLMGGLGPEPGSADAPREWPSLVPEPEPTGSVPTAGANGQPEPVPASEPELIAPEVIAPAAAGEAPAAEPAETAAGADAAEGGDTSAT